MELVGWEGSTLSFMVSVVFVVSFGCTTVFFYIPDFSSFLLCSALVLLLDWRVPTLLSVFDVFSCFLWSLLFAACQMVLEPGSVYVPVMC